MWFYIDGHPCAITPEQAAEAEARDAERQQRQAEGRAAWVKRTIRHLRWLAFVTGDRAAAFEARELEREL